MQSAGSIVAHEIETLIEPGLPASSQSIRMPADDLRPVQQSQTPRNMVLVQPGSAPFRLPGQGNGCHTVTVTAAINIVRPSQRAGSPVSLFSLLRGNTLVRSKGPPRNPPWNWGPSAPWSGPWATTPSALHRDEIWHHDSDCPRVDNAAGKRVEYVVLETTLDIEPYPLSRDGKLTT